jgi:flagellar biosynthesis protein FliQ
MPALPTLRRELITALAVVFAGALLVFVLGLAFVIPRIHAMQVRDLALYFFVLVSVVVGIFIFFGHWLVRRRVLRPIEEMVAQMETIAAGDWRRVTRWSCHGWRRR